MLVTSGKSLDEKHEKSAQDARCGPPKDHLSQLSNKILLKIVKFLDDFEQLGLYQTCHSLRQVRPGHFAHMTIQHYDDKNKWHEFAQLIQSQLAYEKQLLAEKKEALPRASRGFNGKTRVCEHATIDFHTVNLFANATNNVETLCDQHPKCTFPRRPRLVRCTNSNLLLQKTMKMSREEKAKVPECYWKDRPAFYSQPLLLLRQSNPCVATGITNQEEALRNALGGNETRICERLRIEDLLKGKSKWGTQMINLRIYDSFKRAKLNRCQVALCFTNYGFLKNEKGFVVLHINRLLGDGKDPTDPCWLGALIR